jgi:hypothetical protein
MSDLVPQLTDVAADLTEVGLDACLDDGVAKDLPLIGTVIGMARVTRTVRDRLFMRDVVRIIRESQKIPTEKREAFLTKLAANPKAKARLQDCIVRFVLQTDDEMKVEIYAQVFRALVAGIITQESFMRLSLAIRQVYAPDLADLREPSFGSSDSQAFQNCVSSGLTFYREIDHTQPQNKNIITPRWHLTPLGKDLVKAISQERNQ